MRTSFRRFAQGALRSVEKRSIVYRTRRGNTSLGEEARVDFKQLEAFVYVIRLGSFSRAAEQLFLTQPTISTHIKALEEELGTQLVVRTSKEARPSERGSMLYDYALDMLCLRDSAIAACAKPAGGALCGTVAVTASTVPCQHVLPRVTAAFRGMHPAVTFAVACSDSAGVVADVLSGKAEIGLTGTVLKNAKLLYQDFCDDELVVIAPPAEPYASLEEGGLRARDLAKAPFIAREPGSGTRREVEAYLEKKGVHAGSLQVVAQMDNPDAIKNAVAQGLGVSVMSRLSCAEYAQLGRLRMFRLDGERMVRRLCLVRHRHRMLSPAADAFFRYVAAEGGV